MRRNATAQLLTRADEDNYDTVKSYLEAELFDVTDSQTVRFALRRAAEWVREQKKKN